ncbi:putative selenate reductase subunit YgfK [Raoultella planticola]|uniref:Putative selenate reductase subunit YgfK n=1 Tax=Raoultella planticola TaxID=575 RepID=A0A485CP86_RAOPL|nr:putative selenate reductase subunit YgfK [Raoultella planticola]
MKSGKSFIFNMSVGYNLDGIKQPPMQQFINTMMNASKQPEFSLYRDILDRWLHDERFLLRFPGDDIRPRLDTLAHQDPRHPGTRRNAVGRCMAVRRMKLKPFVAICWKRKTSIPSSNSTRRFSAIPRVREILDTCGFGYIALNEESFDHDLKIDRALAMLERLMQLAKEKHLGFGVKLTNTLGTVNNKGALPGR